jgi:cytochrome c5
VRIRRDVQVNKHDLVFLKHFAQVIAGLFVVMVLLIAGAWWVYASLPKHENPAHTAQVDARLLPVGDSYAGETGRAALAAAQAAAKAAAATQVAYDGTLDGSVIYAKLCGACHESGAGGAPQLVRAAWDERIAQGTEQLVLHATQGFQGKAGLMPAKGGNPSLTDEQVAVTVKWMIDNLR